MKISRYVPPFSLVAIVATLFSIALFEWAHHGIPKTGLESNLVERGLTIQPGQTVDVSFKNAISGSIIAKSPVPPEERAAKEDPSDEYIGGGSAFPGGESWTDYRRKDGSRYIVRATKEEMKKARDAEAAEEAHRRDLFQALKTRPLTADERKEALGYRDRLNIEPNTPYFAADKTRELNEAWVVQARIQAAAEAPTATAQAVPMPNVLPITLSEATTSKPILFTVGTGSAGIVMKSPPVFTLPKAPDVTPADLMNEGFAVGAKLGFIMGLKGGDTKDLLWLVEAFKARDVDAVDKWFKEHDPKP